MREINGLRSSLALIVVACAGHAANAQSCQPYFADMGPTSHPFPASNFAVYDDGTGPALYRADYFDRVLIRWSAMGWIDVALTGAPVGFGPIWPFVFDEKGAQSFFVWGKIGTQDHLLRKIGITWQSSGICIGNQCPGWQTVFGLGLLTSVDLGKGPELFTTASRPLNANTFVVRWDGLQWVEIGSAVNTDVSALVPFDDGTGMALYAFGSFTIFAGMPAAGMMKWNGQSWISVPPPGVAVYNTAQAIVANLGNGPAIYLRGVVFQNGQDHAGVNKWNGHEWKHIGNVDLPAPPSLPGHTNTIGAFDDGRGVALYIGGRFSSFQGVAARNIIRFDGKNLEPLGTGVTGEEVTKLYAFQDQRGHALYIGGAGLLTAGAGTLQQSGVLRIGCPNCYANCDLSTRAPALNVNDFICFLNKFAARDPYANCTVDATIDLADFVCFLNKFAIGCP